MASRFVANPDRRLACRRLLRDFARLPDLVMAALRNAAIGILRLTGVTNIAAANRHHARDSTRPLALLGIT